MISAMHPGKLGTVLAVLLAASGLYGQQKQNDQIPVKLAVLIQEAEDALRPGSTTFGTVFRGADVDTVHVSNDTSLSARIWSELSPRVLRHTAGLITPSVAMIEIEAGRYSSGQGWVSEVKFLIFAERRGTGVQEHWEPVLFRTYPAIDFAISITVPLYPPTRFI